MEWMEPDMIRDYISDKTRDHLDNGTVPSKVDQWEDSNKGIVERAWRLFMLVEYKWNSLSNGSGPATSQSIEHPNLSDRTAESK